MEKSLGSWKDRREKGVLRHSELKGLCQKEIERLEGDRYFRTLRA